MQGTWLSKEGVVSESQLRKGAVELVVLGLLSSRPSYGGAACRAFS